MQKKIRLLLAMTLILLFSLGTQVKVTAADGDVAINELNFPDELFRNYVKKFDSNSDGVLSRAELERVTDIRVQFYGISSIKGLEYFPNVTELRCYNNKLTSLDISKNTKLRILYCYSNQLTSLDVSNNPKLELINPKDNLLTSIDVSKNPELINLCVIRNRITSLDVSNNPNLTYLMCRGNSLSGIDVSKNPKLQTLWLDSNKIACVDLSKNPGITDLLTNDNSYTITQTRYNTFDLSKIPGFNASLASNWKGGTVSGNILTIDEQGTTVTYTYDVDGAAGSKSAQFVFNIANPSKPTTYITTASVNGVDAPMPGKELDKTVSCNTAGVTETTPVIIWQKKNGGTYVNATGKADYNTTYRAVITLSPDIYYRFKQDTKGSINGTNATVSYNASNGNLVLSVEYTTAKEKLQSIEQNNVLEVAASVELKDMKLPSTVGIVTDGRITTTAKVDWNISKPTYLDGTTYDINNKNGYSFTLLGMVSTPANVDAAGTKLTTKIKVIVAKEGVEVKPTETQSETQTETQLETQSETQMESQTETQTETQTPSVENKTEEITTEASTREEITVSDETKGDGSKFNLAWLWIIPVAGIIAFIIFIILKRRKDEEDENAEGEIE